MKSSLSSNKQVAVLRVPESAQAVCSEILKKAVTVASNGRKAPTAYSRMHHRHARS